MATGKSKKSKKLAAVFEHLNTPEIVEEQTMTLNGLSSDQISHLIESLDKNPSIEPHVKAPTIEWCKLQLKEQQTGGAWKARIREAGYVI